MNVFICWVALGIILFDMMPPSVLARFVNNTLSQKELDKRARSEGYCDWEQYLYYNVTLEMN